MSVRRPGTSLRGRERRSGPPPWAASAAEAAGHGALAAAPPGLELVPARPFLGGPVLAWFALSVGDRILVTAGEPVIAGAPVAERLRDPRLAEVSGPADDERHPGDRIGADAGGRWARRRPTPISGELVFRSGRRWRVATGDATDPLEAPAAGIVREVRPGTGIALELAGVSIPGVLSVGVPARGRIAFAGDLSGELHASSLDVGLAGTILVVDTRVDAETLTRARAMGVRGVVVAGLAGKELRDFSASEARQRSALHRLPAFAVLVLDGIARRRIAGPTMAVFEALMGREVGIVTDPPTLIIDGDPPEVVRPRADWIRVRHGPLAGREGRWAGAVGPRRFPPGVQLEAGLVDLEEGPEALPIADLERFV